MSPVWILSKSSLRKKKIQNFFITLIILLSAVLLMTAVAIISNSGGAYLNMHERLQGAHQILKIENGLHDPEEVQHWWKQQQGVTVSESMPYHNVSGIMHEGQDHSNVAAMMINTPPKPSAVDELLFDQGQITSIPNEGTVWIPTTLARSKDIQVGDSIGVKTKNGVIDYKVSAVVVDISYSAPFTTTSRIWMSPDDYREVSSKLDEVDKTMISLRYSDYSQSQTYWESFEKSLGTPYLEGKSEFDSLSSFYLVTNKLIAFVMIFLSVVMIAIALYTIYFTISDEIISSYKTIGILSSIGLTSRKIISVYVIQYGLLACLSVVPAVLLSYAFSDRIMDSSVSHLKTANIDMSVSSTDWSWLMAALIIFVIVASSWLFASKARKVEPVQAIRYGGAEHAVARKAASPARAWLRFEQFPASLVIGMRGLIKNVRASSLMVLISGMTSAVLVFGFLFIYSIMSIGQTISHWGYDGSDISMKIDKPAELSYEQLRSQFNLDERVANFSRFGDMNGIVALNKNLQNDSETSMGVYLTVLEGDYNETGVVNLKGRNPMNGDEIAIGVNVAKKLQKEVGDSIEIFVQGKPISMEITGIYQAIANMSNSARLKVEAIQKIQPDYNNMESMFLNVKEGVSIDGFVSELQTKYGTALWVATQSTLVDEVFSEAINVLLVPLGGMGFLFIAVTFIIIYSVCRINIKKESRTYGIFKTIGMTSAKIRLSITTGIFVLSLIGGLLGLLVGVFALPQLLNMVLSNYGIVEVPLVINAAGIGLMVPISAVAAACGAWAASRLILRTSPRILTTEA
ncbi:ABC transporter permease [Paenibacillus arenosi]|uniref:FtsX-like permease family protein n=1 Tax=Paenibacillus arenosi TaxID=2774142 RepID=A0ABR9B067_9BACL|nr:FtsX-like permease family protein [Paenibacillus arenosi]MBD8499802.1 FtsX-like permease family protein [Paenibacillus arenosi]